MQLQVDFYLLQRHLALLQQQELLMPQNDVFIYGRIQYAEALLKEENPQAPATAKRLLLGSLRRRVADRGHFGALLEPLLQGRGHAAVDPTTNGPLGWRGGGLALGRTPIAVEALQGRGRSGGRRWNQRRQRLQRQLQPRLGSP